MFEICVIALVGLPSSGKTSFCQTVLRSSIDLNIHHVCYDELFTFVPRTGAKTFKQERAIVLQQIERIVTSIKSNKSPFDGVSQWKQSSSNVFVILCDDNHYYSGMRYELYKICRKNQLSFGQIYFPLELDIALSRNSIRIQGALPPEVVKQMSERLEEPSTKKRWERDTFIIESDIDLCVFLSFVKKCLQNPLKPFPEEVLEKPQEKDMNAIHGLDIFLRRKIKEHLQSNSGDLCGRAKLLNERRKAILRENKKQHEGDLDVDSILKKLFME